MGSNFTKQALFDIDACLEAFLPEFAYAFLIVPAKNFAMSLQGVKECLEKTTPTAPAAEPA